MFALRRGVGLVLTLVALVVGSFLMIHLIPGDPVRASVGLDAPQEFVQQRRHDLHLDRPIYTQFGLYVRDVVSGSFGTSITTDQPVSRIISSRFPNTAKLAGLAIALVFGLSIPLGMLFGALTADGRRRPLELGFATFTGALVAVPDFLLATFLVFLFAVTIELLPVAGVGGFDSYVLPALAIAVGPTAALARIVRVETLKVLAREYMLTARSKRLPWRRLYLRHALPNLLTGALTIGGLLFAALLGGTVIVENVFAWPGLGTAAIQSILARDYPTVQAIVLLLGAIVVVVNTIVDVLLALLDPRSVILET